MHRNFPVLLSNTILETWRLTLFSLLASLYPIWLLFLLNFYPQVSESHFLSMSAAINQTGPVSGSPHALLSCTQLLEQSSRCSLQNAYGRWPSPMVKPQCPVGSSSSLDINCSICSMLSLSGSQAGFLPQDSALGKAQKTWMWILILPLN